MIRFAVDGITSFSAAPLRLSLYFSLWSVLLAFLVGLYALWKWAAGDTVPGWTSITVIVLVFGGMQMFCIGVIGEYVGRIYTQSKQRPLFVIRSIEQNQSGSPHRRGARVIFQQLGSAGITERNYPRQRHPFVEGRRKIAGSWADGLMAPCF